MKRSSLSNPASYQHWVMSHVGEEKYLIALLDPTRYEDIDTCVAALGFSQQEFEALPNLYEKYALTIRTHGPRVFSARVQSPLWPSIFEQAYACQAASFLVADAREGLLDHLLSLTRLKQPDGSSLLFRFQDVTVLSALAPVLDEIQRAAMVGPASGWFMSDVCATPHLIEPSTSRRQRPRLELTKAQLARLGDALAPFTIIYQANETNTSLLQHLDQCARVRLIRARMHRARRQGLRREDDIALYCVLSLQLPPGFDRHSPVGDALEAARRNGTSFGREIDRIPVSRWREWDQELDLDRTPT
ncbi:DUF4123 domain-containing protein [Xanthomonas oryzae]|uniref:DUF4123 domain-containing protein n=1 Tax=Xanthomonas oryzae TaxID=347 RepID=UPI001F5E7F7B|nr:DUF4123 domain-containing protein [Xanthomonas oryzae]